MTIKIIMKCDECQEINIEDDIISLCQKCENKNIQSELNQIIKHVYLSHDYLWLDKELIEGFKSDEEKEVYLKGVHYGMRSAMFWLCDYFDSVSIWENYKK